MILRTQLVTAALLFLGLSVVECKNEVNRNLRRTTDQKASTEEDRKLTPYGYSTRFGASTVRQSSYNTGYASLLGTRSNPRPPQPQVGYQASSLHRTYSAKTSKSIKNTKDTKAGKNGKAGKAHHTTYTGSLRPYPHYTNQYPQSTRTSRARSCNSFLCSMRWTTIPGQPVFLYTPNIPVIIVEPNVVNITALNSTLIEANEAESFPLGPSAEPTRRPTHTPTLKPTSRPTGTPTLRPTPNPTIQPTKNPTATPTKKPTATPTTSPTKKPTAIPTRSPTRNPTRTPTRNPTRKPTNQPTATPV